MRFDLNCDMGEGESVARARALMRSVTSANVACGGHAGDLRSMSRCVQLAREAGARVGAHPGHWDRAGFGRKETKLSGDELELLLLQQVGALQRMAEGEGLPLSHLKLHGALYHTVEKNGQLRRRFLESVQRWWPGLRVYALAGGKVVRDGVAMGLLMAGELFLDRGYDQRGDLVPRNRAGSQLQSLGEVRARMELLLETGLIETVEGKRIRRDGETLCVHSDHPRAVEIARLTREILERD